MKGVGACLILSVLCVCTSVCRRSEGVSEREDLMVNFIF